MVKGSLQGKRKSIPKEFGLLGAFFDGLMKIIINLLR
jgi:hypothetical protein